jgi:DNA-binding NtrC family response regulator
MRETTKIKPETTKLETILVVDDSLMVLNSVVAILENADFRVLSADGASAVRLAEETDGRIDLLLSGVNLTGLSGPDLGEILKRARPDLHVMLMSGGNDGSLLVLNYGWALIQKRSIPVKLVEMVTDVLRSPNRSQLGGHEFDSRKDSQNAHPLHGTKHKD